MSVAAACWRAGMNHKFLSSPKFSLLILGLRTTSHHHWFNRSTMKTTFNVSAWTCAVLLWVPLAPASILGSGFLASRIADWLVTGIKYYPADTPQEDAGWCAFAIASLGSIGWLFVMPFLLNSPLEAGGLRRTAFLVVGGQMLVLLLSAAISLAVVFIHGIPRPNLGG